MNTHSEREKRGRRMNEHTLREGEERKRRCRWELSECRICEVGGCWRWMRGWEQGRTRKRVGWQEESESPSDGTSSVAVLSE